MGPGVFFCLRNLLNPRYISNREDYTYELHYVFQATNTLFFLLFYAQRRETWCPGALLANAPLASAAALAANSVQVRLARIPSSPSSEESEFDEMSRDAFLSTLEEEEERKSSEDGRRKVAFASPRAKRFVPSVLGQVTRPVYWSERVVMGEERDKKSELQRVSVPKVKRRLG